MISGQRQEREPGEVLPLAFNIAVLPVRSPANATALVEAE